MAITPRKKIKPRPKPIERPTPEQNPAQTDKLLEHILVNQHDHHDLASKQRETQIMQHDQHKGEDHAADAVKIELHGKTNEKLDNVHKAIENLHPVIEKHAESTGKMAEFLQSMKGDPGKDGYIPKKGTDYFTEEELQKVANDVRGMIRTPQDGTTPVKGVDYFTDAEIKDIIAAVISAIPTPEPGAPGKPGKDGEEAVLNYEEIAQQVVALMPTQTSKNTGTKTTKMTAQEIVAALQSLPEKEKLSYNDLKDTPTYFNQKGHKGNGGGASAIRELSDVEITNPQNNDVLKYNSATGLWKNGTGSGGGGTWGTITGTLSAQTDLQAALDAKGSGTVTNVTSANADISVATGTTTPVLTLNSGVGANQIVKLDGSAKLPAVDGSQLTNLPTGFADPMTTRGDIIVRNSSNVSARLAIGSSGKVLRSDGTDIAWTALTTASVAASTDKNYVTDAQLVVIGNTSGTNTGNQTTAGTTNRITVTSGSTSPVIDISASYVGQSSITTLGTITVGVWNGTKIGLAYGGTNADLSATGGTSQVLKQTSNGGAITVAQLAASDLSNGTTGSGAVVLAGSPTLTTAVLGSSTATTQTPGDNSTKVATTAYVDAAVLGQNFKEAAKYGTTAVLPTVVYSNGSSGSGATLTAVGFGALTFDGSTPSVGDRILVKNQASDFQNGIYTVTVVGGVATLFVLTRSTDSNLSFEFKTGDSLLITSGTTLAATTWAYNGVDSPTIGTDSITYVQTAGPGTITSGNGITITGLSVAINTAVTVDKNTAQALTNKDMSSGTNTWPTFNQNTSGSAATLTNARTIGGVSFNGSANITVATATGGFTVSGGDLAIGANNLTLTGSVGATGARVTKGWFTDLEITNLPSVNGTALTTTIAKLNLLTSAAGTTGTTSTNIVFSTSPTLTTPVLGVASATSINKITLTTPATGSTLTIIDGKTLTVNKTISLTAADDTGVYTLPTGTKTLVASDVATLSSLVSIGTITTGGLGSGAVLGAVTVTVGSDASYDMHYRDSGGVFARLANGTTGQVLKATTNAAPSWGSVPATILDFTLDVDFSNSTRFGTSSGGSGSITQTSSGMTMATGATSGSFTRTQIFYNQGSSNDLRLGSPVCFYDINMSAIGTSGEAWFGLGFLTVAGSGITFTGRHIGFKILMTAGPTASLYGTQADGTTENATSALTTITTADALQVAFAINGTSSVDYYWRKNGGAWSAATNLTSNFPSSSIIQQFSYGIDNKSTTQSNTIVLDAQTYRLTA